MLEYTSLNDHYHEYVVVKSAVNKHVCICIFNMKLVYGGVYIKVSEREEHMYKICTSRQHYV